MNTTELKNRAAEIALENANLYETVSRTVYDFHELGNNEYKSTAYLRDELEKIGFKVQLPYAGMDTAIRAEYGEGHPKIAFIAEYDALPGYGPDKNQNGHACGHNFIAANCFGACHILKQLKDETGFAGTIVYLGAPAEETTGGKVDLVKFGALEDIDAAIQIHIDGGDETHTWPQTLAIDSVEFTFEGVASHAAGAPEKGVNALDAAYLTFNGINALRQHVTPDARIHGIITEGGLAANIVPNHAVAQFYVRAENRAYLDTLTQKVINCAKGAELMTGAKMSLRYFENSFDNLTINPVLKKFMEANLVLAGEDDKYIVKEKQPRSGSSDLGNISQVVPTCYVSLAVHNPDGSSCHEEAFLPYCGVGELGVKALHKAVLAQAYTAIDVFADPDCLK